MAKYTGNDLVVHFPTLITANLIKSVETAQSAEAHESSGASDTDKTYLGGKKDATVRIDAWDDELAATLRDKFAIGTQDTVEIYPLGNTVGKPKISGTAIVVGLTHGIPHDGVVPVSIEMQISGGLSETTVSA